MQLPARPSYLTIAPGCPATTDSQKDRSRQNEHREQECDRRTTCTLACCHLCQGESRSEVSSWIQSLERRHPRLPSIDLKAAAILRHLDLSRLVGRQARESRLRSRCQSPPYLALRWRLRKFGMCRWYSFFTCCTRSAKLRFAQAAGLRWWPGSAHESEKCMSSRTRRWFRLAASASARA